MSMHAGVLGLDFGGTKVALRAVGASAHRESAHRESAGGSAAGAERKAGADDGGRAVVEGRLEIAPGEPATSVLERTFALAHELVSAVGGVSAVGVATPGIVLDDRVELAPNVAGWSELSLPDALRAGLGIDRVAIENDVKVAALAEARLGALRGAEPGLYVNLGTGIAIAPVIGGRVLRGAHGIAGEIGYGVVGQRPDWSGAGAPLEEWAGGGGIVSRLARARNTTVSGSSDTGVPEPVGAGGDVAGIGGDSDDRLALAAVRSSVTPPRTGADLLASGTPAATAMWNDIVDELARHLVTAVLTIDPQRIVLGGGMVGAGDALLVPLRERLAAAPPHRHELVVSDFGGGAALEGAVVLARDAVSAD